MKKILALSVSLFSAALFFAQQPVLTVYDTWQGDIWDWAPTSRTISYYNTGGTLNAENFQTLNSSMVWENTGRNEYGYNASGAVLHIAELTWQETPQQWADFSRTDFTYNSEGKVETIIHDEFYDGSWHILSRRTYTYTSGGSEELLELTNLDGTAYIATRLTTTTSNGAGDPVEEIIAEWNNLAWEASERRQYSYTGNGDVSAISSDSWLNSFWNPLQEEINSYTSGNKLSVKTIMHPNGDTLKRTDYAYNNDGTLREEIMKVREMVNLGLENSSRIRYYYQDPLTTEELAGASFAAYPNPAAETVSLVFGQEINGQLSIADLGGRIVRTESVSGSTHQLDVRDLPRGTYVLKGETTGGVVQQVILVGE